MKPGVYKVSWWNRSTAINETAPEPVTAREFHNEAEAARFHDGLDSTRFWTKMETVSVPSVT